MALAEAMAGEPQSIFQQLVDAALRLCGAQSAGVSLLDDDNGTPCFRWRATAGLLAPMHGHRMPRDFSPCGVVVDRDAAQLMVQPGRHYTYLSAVEAPIYEVLLVPFRHRGEPVGTVWVVAHHETKHFEAEDARLVTSLAQFAAAAWQALRVQAAITGAQHALRSSETEQERSRIELAETRELARSAQVRFAAFFDQAPFYAAILDRDGQVIDIGRLALEACGDRREGVLSKPFWDMAWWRQRDAARAQVRSGFEGALEGRSFNAVLPYRFADGTEHVAEFGLSPVFDHAGAVSFVIAMGNDVTERVRAERELAAARRRLDSALIAAELGVYEWDVSADRLYGDANFQRLFPVTRDAAGGAPVQAHLALVHPADRERTAALIERSTRTGENFEADYRLVLPQGERWISSRGRIARDAAGQVVSFFGVVLDITARKRAEAEREAIADELRRLAAVHETVLSSTNDFAYIFDRAGRFQYANRPLLALWGKPLEEIVGRTCYDLGYPTWHADMHMREIATVIATRRPIRGEVAFTGANGATGIYDYIFTPVLGAQGEVELIAGTTRDVTARRRTEDRDRFLVAIDDATRPLTDPREITQTYARMLGEHLQVNRCAYADVEADQNTFNLTGDHNRDVPTIVGRYRFDQFGDECLRLMRAGEPYVVSDAETDPRTTAVREVYAATSIRAVICVSLRKAGQFVGAMAVHQVSPRVWQPAEVELVQLVANRCWESIERARVTRVLAESEQQLRLAVETARLGIWELDLQTNEFSCSAQCKANYGHSPEQPFTRADFWQSVHPEDRERVRASLDRAIIDRIDHELEYQILRPDGSVRWVLARGHTACTPDGRPRRIIAVTLDITGRKQAERELARLHEEAVKASRAKDDFLAALSHELRTPLNPVLLLASESAGDPELSAPVREAFDIIRRNIELEARLIDDLLDLTTITRGKLTVRKEPLSAHDVLRETVAALRADFAEKAIDLRLVLAAQRDRIDGDPHRLLQVFLNLLRNAVKFTPEHGVVTLETAVVDAAWLEVRLSDTGIGMTSPELERAFGAFEQGDHAAERGAPRFGGLGLGLAIARQFVELHQGTIDAFSAGRHQGSRFVVRLPLLVDEGEAAAPSLAPTQVAPALAATQSGRRVLLVEDHEATRQALHKLLSRRGFEVVSLGTLADARAAAERATFDFLISDIGLPDGSGTELMAGLRDRFGLRGIALTGYGMTHDIERSHAAGFVTHLTKPVRIESLEAALAALVD